jgi:hypothetical protein
MTSVEGNFWAQKGGEIGFDDLAIDVLIAMRQDIRFVRLCERLGFVRYWSDTDQWPDCAPEVAPWYDFRAEARRLLA